MIASNRAQPEVTGTKPSVNGLAQAFTDAAPQLIYQEKKLSLSLYRLLANGLPVPVGKLAEASGIDDAEISKTLSSWAGVQFDDNGNVIGFWGLTVKPMQHQLILEDKTLYTWCAWDGLFIPELLGKPATLITQCPISKTRLSVFVDDKANFETPTPEIIMSFLEPRQAMFDEDIIGQFCHYIYLFQDRKTARQWTASNPNTVLLDLTQAMELGRLKNKKQFGNLIQNTRSPHSSTH